jgi:hypothetical protein
VNYLIKVRPDSCGQCGTLLLGEDPEPERHQVTELPRLMPVVAADRHHRLYCVALWGDLPSGVSRDDVQGQATLDGCIGVAVLGPSLRRTNVVPTPDCFFLDPQGEAASLNQRVAIRGLVTDAVLGLFHARQYQA